MAEGSGAASPVRLGIVATHPVQYHAPWFRALAQAPGIDLKVYFGFLPGAERQGDGFGKAFAWDVPLLEGYSWMVLPSWRREPNFRTFFGNVARGIKGRIAQDGRDVVLVTGWESAVLLQAIWAAKRLGLPCIARGESNALRERRPLVQFLHRQLLRQFDAFLAIGKGNTDFYNRYGVSANRIFTAPYFVDNEFFRGGALAHEPERPALRARWGIPEESACVLFAGKLQPKKCVQDLLQALARLEPAGAAQPRIHLLVVGEGPLRGELEAFASGRGLPVTFAGFLNQREIARAYSVADCLVLPSDHGETWGLVVNEAMACGVPAIVSDRVGCGADLVTPGETGEVYAWGDTTALAELLRDVASRREQWREMGRRAQQRVLGEYTVERAVDGTVAAVRAVAGRA